MSSVLLSTFISPQRTQSRPARRNRSFSKLRHYPIMRYFLIVCLSFLFQSCIDKDKIPVNVLSKKNMQSVLWDLMRADEYVADYGGKDSTLNKKEKSIELYEQVFRIHNITRNEFQKSLDFYQGRPDLLKIILDSITNWQRLIMEKQYKSLSDSIKKRTKAI